MPEDPDPSEDDAITPAFLRWAAAGCIVLLGVAALLILAATLAAIAG